jgi:hypothetical protein
MRYGVPEYLRLNKEIVYRTFYPEDISDAQVINHLHLMSFFGDPDEKLRKYFDVDVCGINLVDNNIYLFCLIYSESIPPNSNDFYTDAWLKEMCESKGLDQDNVFRCLVLYYKTSLQIILCGNNKEKFGDQIWRLQQVVFNVKDNSRKISIATKIIDDTIHDFELNMKIFRSPNKLYNDKGQTISDVIKYNMENLEEIKCLLNELEK